MVAEIVDTHLHLWDPDTLRYPWLDTIPLLNKPYLLSDYDKATGGLPIRQMVFVQCEVEPSQYEAEVDWVEQLALHDDRIVAIIPWAPLELGHEAGEAVARLAARPLVKGIRRIIQFEEDPAFCLRTDFVRGVQMLAAHNLHFEICLKGDEQFRNCLELVRRCPDVRFILNHIGKPFIVDEVLSPWNELIAELAALPNTWCKLSGLANEADMEGWTMDDLVPYVTTVVDAFGWSRLMFGGDWPVALLATEYLRWQSTLSELLVARGATDNHLNSVFATNAREFYRIGV